MLLSALAAKIGVPLPGRDVELSGVQGLDAAGPGHLSFLDNPKYTAAAASTRAGAVLVKPEHAGLLPASCIAVVCAAPYAAFARAMQVFYPSSFTPGIHASAVVDATATVHPSAHVGPLCHIGPGCVVGEGCVLVGSVTLLKTKLGRGVLIHSGARLGQDGFGFAVEDGVAVKIPQMGGVVVGNEVEIGANCTIDCGALADTVLEDGVKLDNQVQIAHGARLGAHTRIAGQTGVAGSTRIGAYSVLGGQVAVAGHIKVAERTTVAARSGVTKSIAEPGTTVAGLPAEPIANWRRKMALLNRLVKAS
jgi:UDP-3-O-[3-hydroxymyristoyl] glucosamine N-acyltransferase